MHYSTQEDGEIDKALAFSKPSDVPLTAPFKIAMDAEDEHLHQDIFLYQETQFDLDMELVEDGMVPHDGGAPCWAGADDPPGSCLDRAADLDREDEV